MGSLHWRGIRTPVSGRNDLGGPGPGQQASSGALAVAEGPLACTVVAPAASEGAPTMSQSKRGGMRGQRITSSEAPGSHPGDS